MLDSGKVYKSVAVPEQLFHTILAVNNHHKLPGSASHEVYVLESHGSLEVAKSHATDQCLRKLGLESQDFTVYAIQPTELMEIESWPYGDGVLVFGRASTGSEFRISISTTPNQESLTMASDGTLLLPDGLKHLHYVLQTNIDYNVDRCGCTLATEIVGAYVHRQHAWAAAQTALERDQFAEYDERDNQDFAGQWPFGEDVAIHAISETGQNYYVSVQKPLWANERSRDNVTNSARSTTTQC